MKISAKTKIGSLLKSFTPCEVCGNIDVKKFRFRVDTGKSSVKCEECENIYPIPIIDEIFRQVNEDIINNNDNIIDIIR